MKTNLTPIRNWAKLINEDPDRGEVTMEIVKNQGIQVDAYVNQLQDTKKADQAADQAKESATKTDTVVISDAAKRIQEARAKLDDIPDVREEKVAELRNQIQNGTYQADAEKTADKLLKEQLGNVVFDKLDI